MKMELDEKQEKAPDKATMYAIDKIKIYLDDIALKDETFAKKYPNEAKPLTECWNYICGEARKNSRQCIHSDELYHIAFEFYCDDLKANKTSAKVHGKVMGENKQEDNELAKYEILTEEEKKQIHEEALKKFADKEEQNLEEQKKKEELLKQKAEEKQKAKEKKIEEQAKNKGYIQGNLFDVSGE